MEMDFFNWSSSLTCSAACCGEKPEIFVVGGALEARWATLLPIRRITRLKSATAETLFRISEEAFFT
jgi:hypothetical protein